MTTYTATQAAKGQNAKAIGWSSQKQTAVGVIEVSTNPAPADKFVMCKLPAGAIVLGGLLLGDKLDSTGSGSACMTLNIGVNCSVQLSNGTAISTSTTSNALGATFVIGTETPAVTGYKPETNRRLPLGGLCASDGWFITSADCNVEVTVITSALGFATGTLAIHVDYYMSTD